MHKIFIAPNKALAKRLKKLCEPQAESTLEELLTEVEKIQREDLHLEVRHEPPTSRETE